MPADLLPDPSKIGAIAQPPFAILPDPARVFARRAERLDFLAGEQPPRALSRASSPTFPARRRALAAELPPVGPLARGAGSPSPARAGCRPIDRVALAETPRLAATLDAAARGRRRDRQPGPARAALDALRAADTETRRWLLANVLADDIPVEEAAPHL